MYFMALTMPFYFVFAPKKKIHSTAWRRIKLPSINMLRSMLSGSSLHLKQQDLHSACYCRNQSHLSIKTRWEHPCAYRSPNQSWVFPLDIYILFVLRNSIFQKLFSPLSHFVSIRKIGQKKLNSSQWKK